MIHGRSLVSCLMVTQARADRFRWVTSAIQNYCEQRYRPTELIIVLDDPLEVDRGRLEGWVVALGRSDIHLLPSPRKLSLGALRNLSLDAASGDLICLWDDDDFHHPLRVERQVEHLARTGAAAGLLADCLHLFVASGRCYWVNWGRTRYRGLPGTLLARRDHGLRYPESGPFSGSGEDTDLLTRLSSAVPTTFLPAPPFLYVYRFHGANTWDQGHHAFLANRFCERRPRLMAEKENLSEALLTADLGVPVVTMVDCEGPVFAIGGAGPAGH
jgi:glycosyltransferase involved in cell wall biosynthesis